MNEPIPRGVVVPSSPPSEPRLRLAPVRRTQAVLDGGWWPRSRDPVAEIPGLVVALSERYGRIRQIAVNAGAWDKRLRRLGVGTDVVRLGWFATLDPALLVAITDRGDQLDLLVVPASTPAAAAEQAMARAAAPENLLRAPAILAAEPAESTGAAKPAQPAEPVQPAQPAPAEDAAGVWDSEGGSVKAEDRAAADARVG